MARADLIACEDSETGEVGLKVAGLTVSDGQAFAASTGLLIAHDLLEHQNGVSEIGSIDDELEALGAVWFIRGQFSDISRNGAGSMYSAEENVASDVTRMFCDHWYGAHVSSAPRTCRHDQDEAFADIIRYARDGVRGEIDGSERAREGFATALDTYLRAALARLRIGYRKAAKRWKNDGGAANAQFWSIARAVDPHAKHAELGQRFVLTYGNGEARCVEHFDDSNFC